MNIFGKRLKELRLEKGLTQAALAEKLGLSKPVISMYENGKRIPEYNFELIRKFFKLKKKDPFGIREKVISLTVNFLNKMSDVDLLLLASHLEEKLQK